MAACDALYGVTMETKGVSRQVSVELAQAERFADSEAPSRTRSIEARKELDDETGERVVEVVPRPAAEPTPELAADSG
jgi:hypothetical protein